MNKLWMILIFVSLNGFANEEEVFITIGSDAVGSTEKAFGPTRVLASKNNISLLKLNKSAITKLSTLMHEKFNRCGGFIIHNSKEEAIKVLDNESLRQRAKSFINSKYTISEESRVNSMLTQVKEFNIREMILKLSSYKNRYFTSQTGVDSQVYVKETWEKLTASRSDIKVESYKHSRWPQPSIIATIAGKSKSDEIVIMGGHADSIAGFWSRESARAPGADDNASGIATLTEMIRVIVDSGFVPERTIKFIAYAAEEVGLLGSKEIAQEFKQLNYNIVGVVQYDMTNFKGSDDLDIVFMTDYTNEAQNKFMGALIDKYLPDVAWGYSRCGYGCSDHASWHNVGYPASMPFESTKGDMNGHIHTNRDTIDASGSGGTADHAEKFARLGIAFLVEMGK